MRPRRADNKAGAGSSSPSTSPPTQQHTTYSLPTGIRAQTIDSLVDDGLVGAVVFGNERSPDHAEKKRKAREATFKNVEPISPGGPYEFYNASPAKRRKAGSGFKVPSMVKSAQTERPVRPKTLDRPKAMETPTARGRAKPPPVSQEERDKALQLLRAALGTTFKEGLLADRLLTFWEVHDVDRTTLIRRAAEELELDFAKMAEDGEPYMAVVNDTCDALKLARDSRGVELVTSRRIDKMSDPRVERFKHVAVCFRSVNL